MVEGMISTEEKEIGDDRFTDLGNAMKLVNKYGSTIRYASIFGWLMWGNDRWYRNAQSHIDRLCHSLFSGDFKTALMEFVNAGGELRDVKKFEPHLELIPYVQKLIGYSMTGEIREHVLPVFYGPSGRNGKVTCLPIFGPA